VSIFSRQAHTINPRIAFVTKIATAVLLGFILLTFAITDASWRGAAFMSSMCLAMLFFLPGRADDERVASLKLRALSMGFMGGLALTFWSESQSHWFAMPVTSYDFMCFALAIALGLFHFWCWQDGREDRDAG
jgi:apolipoprotein N-acyltransferase